MRKYSKWISLLRNRRGVYSLDTVMGCAGGTKNSVSGCFDECYAAKSAKFRGYDFSKPVLRYFKDGGHIVKIIKQINAVPLNFIRIGTSGDPSEDWMHTISVIDKIKLCSKQIIIITRHWNKLTDSQLEYLSGIRAIINTSISALDDIDLFESCLEQYKRIKEHCVSILRVVTVDFNLGNKDGKRMAVIQDALLKNEYVIDNVLRLNKRNRIAKTGIVNISTTKFLGKHITVSKLNKKTFMGHCSKCADVCGGVLSPFDRRKQFELDL